MKEKRSLKIRKWTLIRQNEPFDSFNFPIVLKVFGPTAEIGFRQYFLQKCKQNYKSFSIKNIRNKIYLEILPFSSLDYRKISYKPFKNYEAFKKSSNEYLSI
jgi:hypothetical protein